MTKVTEQTLGTGESTLHALDIDLPCNIHLSNQFNMVEGQRLPITLIISTEADTNALTAQMAECYGLVVALQLREEPHEALFRRFWVQTSRLIDENRQLRAQLLEQMGSR